MHFEKGETQGAELNAEGRLLTDWGDARLESTQRRGLQERRGAKQKAAQGPASEESQEGMRGAMAVVSERFNRTSRGPSPLEAEARAENVTEVSRKQNQVREMSAQRDALRKSRGRGKRKRGGERALGSSAHSQSERPPLSGSERLQLPRWAPSVHLCVSVGDIHLTLNHTTPLCCSCACEFFSDFSRIVSK